MKPFFCYLGLLLISSSLSAQVKDWMLAPFIKQDDVNPCLVPSNTSFQDPIRKQKVAWEQKDVFNPAAVVRNGKVYLLYRAQDVIGKPAGTSRIGLAYRSDGLHFTKMKTQQNYLIVILRNSRNGKNNVRFLKKQKEGNTLITGLNQERITLQEKVI